MLGQKPGRAHRIRARVMRCTGLMDALCPTSTRFAAYNPITSEKKVVLYPDFGHEDLPQNDDLTMRFMPEMKA